MTNNTLDLAFVLHTRHYRDNSLLVELFTKEKGKISAVAKGARQLKSNLKHALQLFQPILISCVGRNELVTLTHAEIAEFIAPLQGQRCWCGLYLNELLMYLIDKHDPYPHLFDKYYQTLVSLNSVSLMELPLRYFEKYLLTEIGYGVDLSKDNCGRPLDDNNVYYFVRDKGLVSLHDIEEHIALRESLTFHGKSLRALSDETLNDEMELKEAKRLLRHALSPLLGNKTLKSRELFI